MKYEPAPDLLKDRVILVTGAGDGIGRTAAKSYARHGATVILLGRTVSKLESLYDEIVESGGPEPGIAPMDLVQTSAAPMLELADVINDRYGRLDGLLHNAAILGKLMPFETYDPNEWMQVMQVNLNSVFLLTRVMIATLRKSPDARIIFTSSGVGAKPRAYWGAYSVSKYAMEGLAKLLALEMANTSSIRVNILNPGGTRTRMRAAAFPQEDPLTLKTPAELMPLYLYLMGPDSKGEQGKTFNPDWLAG
ncbi:MAG: YciK family oxidoreductase [Pseudomonadales bacterium]|nr:YciK family oxidoreductase [Pseudomonadales bacterium]